MRSYWLHIALIGSCHCLGLVFRGLCNESVQVGEVNFCANEVIDLSRLMVLNGLHLRLYLLLRWKCPA